MLPDVEPRLVYSLSEVLEGCVGGLGGGGLIDWMGAVELYSWNRVSFQSRMQQLGS